MSHTVEQLGEVTSRVFEKDLGYDPEYGPMIVERTYSDVKVRVSESLVEGTIRDLGLFCSQHSHYVDKSSDLHKILSEMYPNHKGWGHFGVISLDGDVLHIEFRGY